jgi:prefoldin subunit 4
MEVRREDQEKINRFSSLHQKETALEEELRGKIVSLDMQLYAGPL